MGVVGTTMGRSWLQKLCKLSLFKALTVISMSYVYYTEIACRKLGIPMPTEGKTSANLE
jgi:hypothetical protein